MLSDATVLAVIPARGGSKGIPRKNLAMVGGMSLVARAAVLVQSLAWVDMSVLTTDDEEIAAEARRNDLEVISRPDDLASDQAVALAVWRHAWLESESMAALRFDVSVLLQPTSPLRREEDVTSCVRKLLEEDRAAVVTVSPTPAHFAPEKTLRIRNGDLRPYLGEEPVSNRQDIPPYFSANGYCYAAKRSRVIDEGSIYGPRTAALVIDRPVVNIDEPFDLETAEWLAAREQGR